MPRTASRKSKGGRATELPLLAEPTMRNPKKPSRCTKCPGRPLRSECVHTVKGQRFILENNARAQLPQARAGPLEPTSSAVTSPLSLWSPQQVMLPPHLPVQSNDTVVIPSSVSPPILETSPCAGADRGAASQSGVRLGNPDQPLTDIPSFNCDIYPGSFQPPTTNDSELFMPETSTPPSMETYSLNTINTPRVVMSSSQPSPLLVHMGSGGLSTAEDGSPQQETEQGTPSSPTAESISETVQLESVKTRSKRYSRASASSPLYGHVQGVLREPNSPHKIIRTRPVSEPIISSGLASKTFLEAMHSIMIKCEDVSMKTGCWLFIGAQHATASGGALHYASPRLKKDGLAEVSSFATKFLHLIKKIQDARKVDVLELQAQLVKSQQERVASEKVETGLRTEVGELLAEKEKNELLIQEYRSRLGLGPL